MSSKIRFASMALDGGWRRFLTPLFILALGGDAWGACAYQDIDILCNNHTQAPAIYDNPVGTPISDPAALCPPPPATTAAVTWLFEPAVGCTIDF